MKEDILYIARRYRKGKFSADRGWRRLGIAPSFRLRRLRVAASLGGLIILSATAAIIYRQYSAPDELPAVVQPANSAGAAEVKVIDFENTPLTEVVAKIREVYGVEIDGLPDDAAECRLSLHYEGTAADLVDTINEILDTHITVKE